MKYYIIENKYYDNDYNEHTFVYDDYVYSTKEKAQETINKFHLENAFITELELMEG